MLNFSPTAELLEVGGELSPSGSLRYQAWPVPAVSLEFQTWSLWLGDLVHGAAGDGGVGFGVGDGGADSGRSKSSCSLMRSQLGLSEEPQREPPDLRGAMRMSVHLPCSLVPSRMNLSEPSAEAFVDVLVAGLRLPGALVPDHDGAAAVLAFGDDAFEAAVLHGVVFDLDGEAAVAGVVAGALGDGPGFEHAVPAEAEVVVQVRGGVLLDDEGEAVWGLMWRRVWRRRRVRR